MKLTLLPLVVGLMLTVSGCDRLQSLTGSAPVAPAAPAATQAGVAPSSPLPDVGKVGVEAVNAQGNGGSAAEAVAEATRMALRMVNGQTTDLSSDQFKMTLSLAQGNDAEALRAHAFAERIVERSGGAITGFRITRLDGPDRRGFYQADIEAKVARFTPPADSKKLRIVVAPMRYDAVTFNIGGRSVPAEQVAEELRQQVIAALTDSGRFTVLDRDLGGEVNQELELIASGQAPRAEFGKLGQAMSADVVWVGRINAFAYDRHARELVSSNRELVSWSGGWAVSQKLVGVSTRQVMLSESLRGSAPDKAPTTLDTGVDGKRIGGDMRAEIAERIVGGIVSRTFPITVISRDGNNVVLSQGGRAVKENTRYKLAFMGKEMFDPQTSQSLGRMESDCCEIVVDRVMPTMATGRLENLQMPLDGFAPGSLQLRGVVPTRVAAAPSPAPRAGGTTGHPARAQGSAGSRATAVERDDKW